MIFNYYIIFTFIKYYVNTMDKLQIPYRPKLDISKLSKWMTNSDLVMVFSDNKMYEIAYTLEYCLSKNKDYSDEHIDCINSYLEWLKDYPKKYLEKVLIFMILRWLPSFYFLQEKFDIDTKNIPFNVFLKWFDENIKTKNWEESYTNPFLLWKLVSFCNQKEELLLEIIKKWYIQQVYVLQELINSWYFLSLSNVVLPKLNKVEAKKVIQNFKKIVNSKILLDKLTIYWYTDWLDVTELLFENPKEAFEEIKKIFLLSEEEKEEFEYLRQDHFFPLYEKVREDIEEEIEQLWMNITYSFDFTNIYDGEYDEILEKIITEIMVLLNYESRYIIQFVDITGQNMAVSIWNWRFFYGSSYNLFQKEQFYKRVKEYFQIFKDNLQENNMDFCVYIAKNTWSKDPTTDEEDLKLAA